MAQQRINRLALATMALLAVSAAPAVGRSSQIVDVPVAFEVRNTNTSGLPCLSDGRAYKVHGELVAPRSALAGPGSRVVTLYVHGFGVDAGGWSIDVPGYDYGRKLAARGHASVFIDLPPYGPHGTQPHGFLDCFGSEATIVHQILAQLRGGTYSRRREPTSFDRIVLAGHDVGGSIAEIEAYSYRDIDALMLLGGWAEQGFKQTAYDWGLRGGLACDRTAPGGPGGYTRFPPSFEDAQRAGAFYDMEPEVVNAIEVLAQVETPCAWLSSVIPLSVTINPLRLGEIDVPVFLLCPNHDVIYTREGCAAQRDHFRGSDDVTLEQVETGHFPWLERRAPEVRARVAEWLRARGLVSAEARTSSGCPAANTTRAGSRRDDRIAGTRAAENLIGRAGADRLAGRGGHDCIVAGPGPDRIRASDGRLDRVHCGRGRDSVVSDPGDRVRGCERMVRRSG